MCRRSKNRARALVIVGILLLAHTKGQGVITIVQQDGVAEGSIAVPFVPDSEREKIVRMEVDTESANILTSLRVNGGPAQSYLYLLVEAEGDVGRANLVVKVQTDKRKKPYEFPYAIDVIGVAILDAQGRVLSGDVGKGLIFDNYKSLGKEVQLKANAYRGSGVFADMARCSVDIRDFKKTGLITDDSIEAKGSLLKITPNKNRVGKVELEIEHPDIVYQGEIPSTIFSITVGDKPYPKPVVTSASQPTSVSHNKDTEKKSAIKLAVRLSTKMAKSEAVVNRAISLGMLYLVDRPDTPTLVAVRAMVEDKAMFRMDDKESLLKTIPQKLIMVPVEEVVADTGIYGVDKIEAEYDDGTILDAVLEVPVKILVIGTRKANFRGQNVAGVNAFAWAPAVGIATAFVIIIGIAGFVLRQRSISAAQAIEPSYEGDRSIDFQSQEGSSRAFEFPIAPSTTNQDELVQDSYARNDNFSFSHNDVSHSDFDEASERCSTHEYGSRSQVAATPTSSWFAQQAPRAGSSEHPSSNFSF